MYNEYDKCLNCSTKLDKKNFGRGHSFGTKDKIITEAVCKKCESLWVKIKS